MKTKSIKALPIVHTELNLDLFGDVAVTWPEVYYWCKVVTRGKYSEENRNLQDYIKGYAVIDKIKAFKKIHGTLDQYFAIAANDSHHTA